MVMVHRNGVPMTIPRKLSHHVPTVPIKDTDDFQEKLLVKFHDTDSDEFQLYKVAVEEEYRLQKAAWEVVGKPKMKLRGQGSGALSAVEARLLELLQGAEATPEEILRILRGILVAADVKRMEEMLQQGEGPEKVIKHFLKVRGGYTGSCY